MCGFVDYTYIAGLLDRPCGDPVSEAIPPPNEPVFQDQSCDNLGLEPGNNAAQSAKGTE